MPLDIRWLAPVAMVASRRSTSPPIQAGTGSARSSWRTVCREPCNSRRSNAGDRHSRGSGRTAQQQVWHAGPWQMIGGSSRQVIVTQELITYAGHHRRRQRGQFQILETWNSGSGARVKSRPFVAETVESPRQVGTYRQHTARPSRSPFDDGIKRRLFSTIRPALESRRAHRW